MSRSVSYAISSIRFKISCSALGPTSLHSLNVLHCFTGFRYVNVVLTKLD